MLYAVFRHLETWSRTSSLSGRCRRCRSVRTRNSWGSPTTCPSPASSSSSMSWTLITPRHRLVSDKRALTGDQVIRGRSVWSGSLVGHAAPLPEETKTRSRRKLFRVWSRNRFFQDDENLHLPGSYCCGAHQDRAPALRRLCRKCCSNRWSCVVDDLVFMRSFHICVAPKPGEAIGRRILVPTGFRNC